MCRDLNVIKKNAEALLNASKKIGLEVVSRQAFGARHTWLI